MAFVMHVPARKISLAYPYFIYVCDCEPCHARAHACLQNTHALCVWANAAGAGAAKAHAALRASGSATARGGRKQRRKGQRRAGRTAAASHQAPHKQLGRHTSNLVSSLRSALGLVFFLSSMDVPVCWVFLARGAPWAFGWPKWKMLLPSAGQAAGLCCSPSLPPPH